MYRKYFRRGIDGLVILMFVWLVWPYVAEYLPFGWYDEVLPDEVIALDEKINEVLFATPKNFAVLYANPSSQDEFELQYLSDKQILNDKENYQRNVESVVYINGEDETGLQIYGSGTILSKDGLILTNNHVVEGMSRVVVTTHDGVHYPVKGVAAVNKDLDIAFLLIEASDLIPVSIGNSNETNIGDKTLVIGNPEGFIYTLSLGNISGIRTYNSKGGGVQFQITNPISGGNSGGAVLNEYGELIAVPTWSLEYEYNIVQVQNLNFAIPINEALSILPGTSEFQTKLIQPVTFGI